MKAKKVIKGSLDANLDFKRIFEITQELKKAMFYAKIDCDLDEATIDANLDFKRIFEIAQELKKAMVYAKIDYDLDEATNLLFDSLERQLITTQYYVLKKFVNDKDEYQKKFVESYEYLLAISREN